MPQPTTIYEVEMAFNAWRAERDLMLEIMRQTLFPPLFDLIRRRCFPQRPHTDDMMQMLADIGVEPPADFTGPSFDGLTFRFR
jgi:hypothetical protein